MLPPRLCPFTFALASGPDDPEIRRLLRENPLPGDVSLSFEREPEAFLGASIEGDVHQTLLARSRATGEVAGFAARSVRTAFLNGRAARLGYLGQFRVAHSRRYLRAMIDDGFAFCRTLHEEGDAPAYLTSLVADNHAARRLLVERRWSTAPRFTCVDELHTFVIPVRRVGRALGGSRVRVCQGSAGLLDQIAACLQRNLRRYQFAPCWDPSELPPSPRTRGLLPEDFVVAVADGRIIGCAALWDQRAFKQVVVRGYRPALRRVRPVVNLAASLLGLPRLPDIGRRLQFAYLSHVAVDDDRHDVLGALIAAQVHRARQAGLDYLVVAFSNRHPFHAVVRRQWAHRTYRSVLYIVHWPDAELFMRSLDSRPAQPEVAIL